MLAKQIISACGLLLALYLPVCQSAVDLNFNEDAFRFTWQGGKRAGKARTVTDAGLLYVENQRNDSTLALHGGYYLGNRVFHLGGRLLFANPDSGDFLGLGLGGDLHFRLNRVLGLGGYYFHAPGVTTTMDAESWREFGVRLAFRITRSDDFYVGYRSLEYRLDSSGDNLELEEGLHIGFRLNY